MAIYNKNGSAIMSAYNKDGVALTAAYNANGEYCFPDIGHYETAFYSFVNDYIEENGLYIDGISVTKDQMTNYLLNRDTCLYRGKLSKSGKYVIGEDGKPFELRGIGTHHLTQYHNLHTLESLRALKYCGVNCIRMSAYLKDHKFTYSDGQNAVGYLTSPNALKAEMDEIIQNCVELGLYVIVDWHVWSGGGETLSTDSAVEFFTYFAEKYASCKNILYELANEPFSDTLADIVSHCKTLRELIRSYVVDPVLITGIRSFTNGVMEMYNALQAENIDDIFLSQHRYSGGASIETFRTWWENGIPLFITEWSNTSASTGTQSSMNITEGNNFLIFFHENSIPNCIWKFTDQTMAYAVMTNKGTINNQYYASGKFLRNDFSEYGQFMFDRFSSFAFASHIDRQSL